ncbi:MAG: DUF2334 domain-containing protein [Myxococcota bacterium]|jgi:hypothetical protein|nr:DUF2334 domain-containing protein [Myxococcota bacterium]
MRFVIRDDDPSAMTLPDELEACWGGVWDSIPVGLSVTPFRIPGTGLGVPEAHFGGEEPIPLEDNQPLVRFLRELIRAGKVHIAMHGYNHTRPLGKPEYVAGDDLEKKTRHGRAYLESVLGCEVATFVPPNNTMGLEGFRAVASAGMNVVNNQPYGRLLGFPRSPSALADFALAGSYALRRKWGGYSPFEVQSFAGFKQAPYQTVGPETDLKKLERTFELCHGVGGLFVLATHYHAFERKNVGGGTVRQAIEELVEMAKRAGQVEFQTYTQVWRPTPS